MITKKRTIFILLAILINVMIVNSKVVLTGCIKEDNGETLPGVSVMLKGTNKACTSNQEGVYSIEIPDTLKTFVLVFNFIGMQEKEVSYKRDSLDNKKFYVYERN